MKAFWLAAALAVSAAVPSPGAAAEGAVSPGVEARLDAMLADILGHGRGRAFVRPVTLPADAAPPPEGDAEAPAALWDRLAERLRRTPPVLPGFPAPRSLREEALRELVGRAAPAPAPPSAALSVTLVVDDAVTEDELKAASDAVARALELAADRGDTLRASRAPLAPTLAKSLADPLLRSAAAAGGTAGLLALAGLVVVALAVRARGPAVVRVSAPAAAPASPPAPVFTAAPAAEPSAAAPPDPELPILGSGGAAAVAELLRDGPAAAADWLLRRASAAEAAAVYARLPRPVRLDAARLLADAAGFEPPPADAGTLVRRAAHRVLGLERLEDVLLRAGPDLRAEAAGHLRLAAPAAAARLASLPLFPELSAAAAEDLRLCLSPFSTARLAAALGPEPAAVRDAFLDALPGVAADLVRERLEGAPSGGAEAQGEVLARWRGLERAGRVRPLAESAAGTEPAP